jgi:tRNA(Arg) A34 adenosine deaminase TadA
MDDPLDTMHLALEEARIAATRGEVPVGAVVSDAAGTIWAARGNEVELLDNPIAHAEFLALQKAAAAKGTRYLSDCTLTVTLEPCALCAGAIAAYRIKKLIFAAYDAKSGAVEHGPKVFSHATTHHKPEIVGGVRESEASAMLKAFFGGLRS